MAAVNIKIAAATGMVAGVVNTYTLGRLFIKEKKVYHSNKRLTLFGVYYALMIFITSYSIEIMNKIWIFHHYVVWFICTVIAAFFNFLFLSYVALRD